MYYSVQATVQYSAVQSCPAQCQHAFPCIFLYSAAPVPQAKFLSKVLPFDPLPVSGWSWDVWWWLFVAHKHSYKVRSLPPSFSDFRGMRLWGGTAPSLRESNLHAGAVLVCCTGMQGDAAGHPKRV